MACKYRKVCEYDGDGLCVHCYARRPQEEITAPHDIPEGFADLDSALNALPTIWQMIKDAEKKP